MKFLKVYRLKALLLAKSLVKIKIKLKFKRKCKDYLLIFKSTIALASEMKKNVKKFENSLNLCGYSRIKGKDSF